MLVHLKKTINTLYKLYKLTFNINTGNVTIDDIVKTVVAHKMLNNGGNVDEILNTSVLEKIDNWIFWLELICTWLIEAAPELDWDPIMTHV